jgi:lysophospholipase L1-like esterase
VVFVDLAEQASPRFLGVPEATSPDGFHPSPVGYGFWADALAPAVVEALAER